MPDIIGNVLIDKDNSNIVSLQKVEEHLLYLLKLGVSLDHKKIGRFYCTVPNSSEKESTDGILWD